MSSCGHPSCAGSHGQDPGRVGLDRRRALGLAFGCGAALVLNGCATTSTDQTGASVDGATLEPRFWGHPGLYSARAVRLVETSNTIDMLVPVRNALVLKDQPNSMELAVERFMSWFDDPASIPAEQFARFQASGIKIFNVSIDLGQLNPGPTPYDKANLYFEGWKRIVAAHPDVFHIIANAADLSQVSGAGKLKLILGLQNGDHFRTVEDVAHFRRQGQMLSQLTYNAENHLGGGAFSDVGLKPFGAEVIRAMNRVGMVVDLAHANDRTSLEAAEASEVTPIISHTNCRALNPGFTRAMPDEVIRAFAARGGVIGVTVVRQFVTAQEPTTIEDYINHIDHIANLVGIEHVGIGSDTDLSQQDGVDDEAKRLQFARSGQEQYRWRERTEIDGLDHPRRLYDITEGLVRRGYSDAHIRLVLGGNWQRVLGQVWNTRV
jgi:membrane dipeptidase